MTVSSMGMGVGCGDVADEDSRKGHANMGLCFVGEGTAIDHGVYFPLGKPFVGSL